jgi:hypothetical protein
MRVRLQIRRAVAALLLQAAMALSLVPAGAQAAAPAGSSADVTVNVQAGSVQGPFNRALLSWTDFWSLLGTNALGWNAYALSNPSGTLQRQGVDLNNLCPASAGTCAGGQGMNWNAMFDYVGAAPNAPGFPPDFKGTTPLQLVQKMVAYGEQPQLLFTGRKDLFQNDPADWANLVVQVVQYFKTNGITIPAVEIWNEPNCCGSQPGTLQQYEAAFQATSQAVHAAVPGVMVTGPAYCCDNAGNGTDAWPFGFLSQDASAMDAFVWHDYGGKGPADTAFWLNALQTQYGIAQPKLMVTESDWDSGGGNRIQGYAKNEALLGRLFGLLPYQSDFLSWDQFHLGNYLGYGMINGDGSVVDKNYWPYWLLRDAVGDQVAADVSVNPAGAAANATQDVLATAAPDGSQVNAVLYVPSAGATAPENVDFHVALPSDNGQGWILSVSELTPTSHNMIRSAALAPGTASYDDAESLVPGAAVSLTFRRADTAVHPYVNLSLSSGQAMAGGSVQGELTVFNTTGQTLSGTAALQNVPSGWGLAYGAATTWTLAPGASADIPFQVSVPGTASSGSTADLYGVASYGSGSAMSVTAPLRTIVPVKVYPAPDWTYMAPGETRAFDVTMTNVVSQTVTATLSAPWPAGWSVATNGATSVSLQPGQSATVEYEVTAPADITAGQTWAVKVVAAVGSAAVSHNVHIIAGNYDAVTGSIPVDLGDAYNGDGFSYDSNPGDGNLDGGHYTLPAEWFQGNRLVRFWGVQFQTPNTADGQNNEVVWNGQSIPLSAVTGHALGMLVTATNGNQTANLTLGYTDGSTQQVSVPVNDWCKATNALYSADIPVIHFGERHSSGDTGPACGIFYVQVPVGGSVPLASVTLGANKNLHLFALSVLPTLTALPAAADVAYGPATVTVAASVYDASGHPLAGVPVTFTTDFGTLSTAGPVATDAGGGAAVELTADHMGMAHVTASMPGTAVSTVTVPFTDLATTATGTPAPNPAGWNNTDVALQLSPSDSANGGGVTGILYSGTGAQAIAATQTSGNPVSLPVTAEGVTTVSYSAQDGAGAVEPVQTVQVRIDRTPPTVTFTGAGDYTVDQAVYVNCTASDALSGLAGDPCTGPLVAAPAYTLGLGSHTVTVTATDRAGNATTASATYTVQVTLDSLAALTRQFEAQPGVANSLVVKLNAAKAAAARGDTAAERESLAAYQNDVAAQSGQTLTPDQASVLESLAQALI